MCNRVPHSALQMESPNKALYRKGPGLPHLKTVGARGFVHVNEPTKLGHTFWEGMVCAVPASNIVTPIACGTQESELYH